MMKLVTFTLMLKYCSIVLAHGWDMEFIPPQFSTVKHYHESDDRLWWDNHTDCACSLAGKKWLFCLGGKKCVKFPEITLVKANRLTIRTSNIRKIQVGDLKIYSHLTRLEIEDNRKLEELEPGCFQHMTNLRNLSISYNELVKTLHEETFEGLANLRELQLVKNGLNNLQTLARALSPSFLPSLIHLKLTGNQLFQVQKNDLSSLQGSNIEVLNLAFCRLDFIHPESLLPLRRLSTLRLGQNTFNTSVITDLLRTMMSNNIPLKALNLYGTGLRKKPPRDLMQVLVEYNVTTLSLASNQFDILTKDSFPYMPNLKTLDLHACLISDITADTFSKLPNLQSLFLNKNQLSYFPDGVILPHLTYLDLSLNSGTSPFFLGVKKFVNVTKLWGLNLVENDIRVLFNSTFEGLSNLRILNLRNASLRHVSNGTFLPLKNLRYLDLGNNTIGALNRYSFAGLENLQVLLLENSLQTTLLPSDNPFEPVASLRRLDISRNGICYLYPQIFAPMKQLSTITLSYNSLPPWHERMFANNSIERLYSSNNQFTSISKAMLRDFSSLKDLDLSMNPISCDCGLVKALLDNSTMKKNVTMIKLIGEEPPLCIAPPEYSQVTVIDYYESVRNSTKMCYYAERDITYIVTAMVILLLVLPGVIYRYRWHFRFWFFLAKISVIRKGKKLQRSRNYQPKSFEFDAFVSYSNEDSSFVNNMVSMLEDNEPHLKLCVYERDFQIGCVITDKVLECVGKSRKTILVISDSYIRSQWCRWEAQVAENYRLFFQNEDGVLVDESILVIKLGDINKAHRTPMLKYLMKTKKYLQWEPDGTKQEEFWRKLRSYLCPSRRSAKSESISIISSNEQVILL